MTTPAVTAKEASVKAVPCQPTVSPSMVMKPSMIPGTAAKIWLTMMKTTASASAAAVQVRRCRGVRGA